MTLRGALGCCIHQSRERECGIAHPRIGGDEYGDEQEQDTAGVPIPGGTVAPLVEDGERGA
jgi:hypothetical protein